MREAWQRSKLDISRKYFFEGAELSIDLSKFSLSEFFQCRCHCLFSLSLFS